MRIVTLTVNPAVDASTSVALVVADRKLRCLPPRFEAGGGGLNVARAIHQLGGEAEAMYLAGGPTGDRLRQMLARAGVRQHPIAIAGWTRENLTVQEEASGRQFRFCMPGPAVRVEEWQRVLAAVRQLEPRPDYLVASGSLPPGVPDDFYAEVARTARDSGSAFLLDTSGAPLALALRVGAYLVKPNVGELAELTGAPIEGPVQLEAAAKALLARVAARAVVVSLGAAGALAACADWCEPLATPTVQVRSRVGAGDSMLAGIVLGLARGWPLRDAVRFGLAAGSAAVMAPGTGLCRREDAERLYAARREGPTRLVPGRRRARAE